MTPAVILPLCEFIALCHDMADGLFSVRRKPALKLHILVCQFCTLLHLSVRVGLELLSVFLSLFLSFFCIEPIPALKIFCICCASHLFLVQWLLLYSFLAFFATSSLDIPPPRIPSSLKARNNCPYSQFPVGANCLFLFQNSLHLSRFWSIFGNSSFVLLNTSAPHRIIATARVFIAFITLPPFNFDFNIFLTFL